MTAKKKQPKAKEVETLAETITAIKGFNLDMTCRGMKYELGKTYTHDGDVRVCESGFHSVEYAPDVFGYYAPGTSVYAEVDASGSLSRHADDSKIASGRLHVKVGLTIPDIVARTIAWVLARCNPATSNHTDADQSASAATGHQSASSATGDQSASSATGDHSASAATGDQSASAATGHQSASSATGDQSASSATGDHSASAATGDQSASSATGDHSASAATGDQSASAATGHQSASSATGDQSASSATGDHSASAATGDHSASAATGYQSASSATGDRSASSATGDQSASSATGKAAVALNTGRYGSARAAKEGAIVLCEHDDEGNLLHIRASKVGCDGIKEDTYYTLKDGEFVEVTEES